MTNDILASLRIPAQRALDIKTHITSEGLLLDLGVNNHRAFTYYLGMKVFCVNEETTWIWREVKPTDGPGKLPSHFTYPDNLVVDGVTYSNKQYNFFKEPVQINNFVKLLFINVSTLPVKFTKTDICTKVLSLPAVDRELTTSDSKMNIVLLETENSTDHVKYIYEVVNKGVGIISTLTPNNLLLIEEPPVKVKDPFGNLILEAIVPFNRSQILNDGGKLKHNLKVLRYLTEHFSYSNVMFNQDDFATLTPTELKQRGVISGYNYLNPNEIELKNFINYKSFITNSEYIYYVVKYISAEGLTFFTAPDKFVNYNYNHSYTPANNNAYIPLIALITGMASSYGNPISGIEIIQLPTKAEISQNNTILAAGTIVPVSVINNNLFEVWLSKMTTSSLTGDYTDSFQYKLIDTANNKSNVITYNMFVTDTFIQYTADTPKSVNFDYTPGEAVPYDIINQSNILSNVVNSKGLPTVGIKIISLPTRGTITENGWSITPNYVVSLTQINNNKFAFWEKGIDNLQPSGDFNTSFTFRAIDSQGNLSNLITLNIIANDTLSNAMAEIQWNTGTGDLKDDRSGTALQETIYYSGSILPAGETMISEIWQQSNGVSWNDIGPVVGTTITVNLITGINLFRLKIVTNTGTVIISNVLKYTKTTISGSGSGGGNSTSTSNGGGGQSSSGDGGGSGSGPGSGSGGSGGSGGEGPDSGY